MKRLPEIRLELVIATLALCASAAASIATVVQTSVVANQLSASVWPYLTFDTTVSPGEIRVGIENDGLGPGIVRSVRLTLDGKPRDRWRDVFAAILPHRRGRTRVALTNRSIGPGSVVRPASEETLLDVRSPLVDASVDDLAERRVGLAVCYCSILGQCWTIVKTKTDEPQAVHDCGPAGAALVF